MNGCICRAIPKFVTVLTISSLVLAACATHPDPAAPLATPVAATAAPVGPSWALFNAELGMAKDALAPQLMRRHRYWPSCEVRDDATASRVELCVYGEFEDRPAALQVLTEPLFRLRYAFLDDRLMQVQGQFANALTGAAYVELRERLTPQFGQPVQTDDHATQWSDGVHRAVLDRVSLTLEYHASPPRMGQN